VEEKKNEEKRYSTKAVAVMCKCHGRTVRKWAEQNGVYFTGEGRRKDYHFSEADIEAFKVRPKPGRRWQAEEKS